MKNADVVTIVSFLLKIIFFSVVECRKNYFYNGI